jgi:hypothetical protein
MLRYPNKQAKITAHLKHDQFASPRQPSALTKEQHDIASRFIKKLNFRRTPMTFSVRPLFRKMKADGTSYLSHDDFRRIIGTGHLNLGLNKDEETTLIAGVCYVKDLSQPKHLLTSPGVHSGRPGWQRGCDICRFEQIVRLQCGVSIAAARAYPVVTCVIANRLGTVDHGRSHDPMLASTARELEGHRVRFANNDRELGSAGGVPEKMQNSSEDGDVDGVAGGMTTLGPLWSRYISPPPITEPAVADRRGIGFGWLQNAWLLHASLKIHRGGG